ncbi:6498_t:CDS:2 [Paraglomus brasilianum]|uniref:6498_t:CDS:1 n=1 Tax=Paraglomus brasilianum TaxID=144538 RepID=A0A9N8WGU5_9GLOM|nr:6498_t:CDS:2 [Paraglomus brasilianum]
MNTQPAPGYSSLYRLPSNSTSDVPQSDRLIEPSLHGTDSNSDDDALTVGGRPRINSMTNLEFIEAIASSPVPRSPMSLQCCCGREDCSSLQSFYRSARSLEEELRLAAEVGQTVLQRHQMTQREMGELEERLTEQCVAAEQRAQELEDIVRELKESQRKLTSDRDDATRQKYLLEKKNESLTLQLDDRDAQLRDLNKEFKECEDEIKRLMTNKLNAERGEEREDELRRQLEDLKQELNVARKAESAAEARVKKLKAKYDTLHTTHEKLKKEYQEYPISVPKQKPSEFFNDRKPSNCGDDANRSSSPNHEANTHLANRIKELSSENNKLKETNTCFTAMIRELSSANDKLKAQITEYKEMLTETRNEVSTLQDKIVDMETASAHGYSTYAASYTTNTSVASPFVRALPPHVSDEVISIGEQSEITATAVDDIAEASNPQATVPRPILTQLSTFPLSSSLGPTTPTLNSLGVDNSLNSPAGSAAMLSSSNPLHYHHYYHHYHHYAPESPEVPRGSVLGELEKEIKGVLKQQSRRRQHDSYKRNKAPLDTVNDVDEEEILTDRSESTAENKTGRSEEIVYDIDTSGEDSDGERDVNRDSNAEENTKNRRGKRTPTVGKSSSAKLTKAQQKAKAKDGISDSPKKKQRVSPLSTTLKGNNVSLLSAGLKKSTESAALKNDADKKKRVPSINTKGKDEMKSSHRRTPLSPTTGGSLSRRPSAGKSTGASTSTVSKHKPTQSSPLAQRRAASATPSSLSVRVSQSSNSPTSGKSTKSSAERLSMPAFKNPKFATLGPRERKAMMEAWRAGVAKEHEVFLEDNLDTATITDECGSTSKASLSQNATPTGVPSIMVSTPAERNDADTNNRDLDSPHHQSPYQALFNLCTHLMDRLKGTDIIALNRRLKREFDILELSSLSNNLIENILSDVENLRERFRWVEELRILEGEKTNVKALHRDFYGSEGSNKDLYAFSPEEFLPLTHFMQDTLAEIGKLRMLVNDVQVSYFQKVEESRRKAEEEFGKSVMNGRNDNEARSNQSKRRQRNEGGISGYLSRVFGGLKEQPPNTTRHHTRRMSVEYSHEREISVGSIDTFAEDSYFADRNAEAYRASNTRRESVESVGSIVRKSMVSFFGVGGGGSNGNTNMSTTSTVYETREEEVEKARNSKGLKMNLEDTRGGRNVNDYNRRSHRLSMSNYWRESGMDRSLLSSFSITPPLRSPTFTAIRSSESETSSLQPVLAAPPPPTIETAAIRKARTVSSASTLESRLRQHLAAASSSAGDSASVKDDSQKDEGSESFFDKWFG